MLSLWVLGRATEFERAAVAADRSRRKWIAAIAVALAVAIATLSLRPGRRRSGAPALLLPRRWGRPPQAFRTSPGSAPRLRPTAEARVRPGPGTALGRYLLVDRIGAGGMAEVFTAVSFGVGKFRRPFVIKRLRAELDGNATAIGLFIDEANLASTLVHPNVVPVFDFGEVAGSYFLAEEYIVGRDLGRITSRLRDRDEPLLSTKRDPPPRERDPERSRLRARQARRRRQPAGAGPPRHHAGERDRLRAGRGEDPGLRHHEGEAARLPDRQRHGERKRRLHVTRAGARPRRRSPLRSVLDRTRDPPRRDRRADLPRTDVLRSADLGCVRAGPRCSRPASRRCPRRCRRSSARALAYDPDKRFQSSAEFSAAIAPHLESGGQRELAHRLLSLFGDELRAEQDRLAAAYPSVPRPEPVAGAGA